jgi:ubiquinone biosynthesis accessory factor UbiJ
MLTGLLQRMLDRGLEDSPRARTLCAELAGRALCVECTTLPFAINIAATDTRLAVQLGEPRAADASIRGGPLALMAMLREEQTPDFAALQLSISGDGQIARQFQQLARLLRPDLEAGLGSLLGPIGAHLLARAARTTLAWGQEAAAAVVRNGAEYLAHESAVLVPQAEAEQFLHGVDLLRERLERLAAQADYLQRRAAALSPRRPASP